MKILCTITGSRADASPLAPVIAALKKYPDCELHHIQTRGLYGNEDHVLSELKKIQPHAIIILGDRIETALAAVVAASLGICIIHLHGGEETLGAVDNTLRYCISSLASVHLVSHEKYKARLVQMGESPDRIFVCGAPGVDALIEPRLSREEIEKELGIMLEPAMALVCYHPTTLGTDDFEWTWRLKDYSTVVVSGSNADIGGKEINEYWQKNHTCYFYQETFSQKMWLALMWYSHTLIGNSSSFIFEGMTMNSMLPDEWPSKNIIIIGERQSGRYEDALEFFKRQDFPYGKPGAVAPKIAETIMALDIPKIPRKKLYG